MGLSPATVAVAIQDLDDRGAATGVAAALDRSDEHRGRLQRRRSPRAARRARAPTLEGAFRTPTLRCAASHPSFMHTGQMTALDQVVAFFDRGGDPAGGYPGTSELHALGLTERERADLVAFMGALAGPGPDAALLVAP